MSDDGAVWLQLVLVNKAQNRHVVLETGTDGDDGVVLIDDFLQGSDVEWSLSDLVDLFPLSISLLLLVVLDLLLLEVFLVGDEFLGLEHVLKE